MNESETGIIENVLKLETEIDGRGRFIKSATILTALNSKNRIIIQYAIAR